MPYERNLCPSVISIPEEDDIHDVELSGVERRLRDLQHARNTGQRIPFIDLTQDEQQQRDLVRYEIQIINELERSYRHRTAAPLRSLSLPRLQLPSFRYNQTLIKEGTCVEVPQRPREEYCWQFLHVLAIYTDSQSPILRGIKLTRHRHLRGLLPRFKNEVCALYDINQEDQRPENIQAAVEIPVTEVIRTRALLRTNDAFPSHRFNRSQWETVDDIENKAVLVQRWKHHRYWPTTEAMASKKSYSGAVVRLRCSEIEDPYLRVADDKLRNEFRGGIIRGGSFRGGQITIPTVCVEEAQNAQAKDTVVTLGHNQKCK